MSITTATLYGVPHSDGRAFPIADVRRQVRGQVRGLARTIGGGAIRGLGAAAAVGGLVIIVTVTAAWLLNTALVNNPRIGANISARPFTGPGALALATSEPSSVRTADTSFESRWARASTSAAPLLALQIADEPAQSAVASAPASAEVAKLTPAVPLPPKRVAEQVNVIPLPPARPHVAQLARLEPFGPPIEKFTPQAVAPQIVPQAAPQIAMVTPAPEKRAAPVQEAHNKAFPELDSRTAIYDISARTVFLPSGQKLEAHSGLYDKMDDPKYVHVRMRGATPPNIYDLTLREQLFHGVRAIRLNPVDERKMFGRDGMLAHTYMLGPNGQSNGCVSFKDYNKFLQAFLRGEVDRLVVVPEGGTRLALVVRERRGQGGRYAANDVATGRSDRAW